MRAWVMEARAPFAELAAAADPLAWLAARQVETYRDVPGRRTFSFRHAGETWFAKVHLGVGFAEVLKNAAVGRLPVFDAQRERLAAQALAQAGVAAVEVLAHGQRGAVPWRRRSFAVLRAVAHVATLDELARKAATSRSLSDPVARPRRRRLLLRLGELVGRMHEAGVDHRDLYLVHVLVDEADGLHLIDLHRASVGRVVPRAALRRDLAALWFSARAAGAGGAKDRRCFLAAYGRHAPGALARLGAADWRRIERRVARLLRRGARG